MVNTLIGSCLTGLLAIASLATAGEQVKPLERIRVEPDPDGAVLGFKKRTVRDPSAATPQPNFATTNEH